MTSVPKVRFRGLSNFVPQRGEFTLPRHLLCVAPPLLKWLGKAGRRTRPSRLGHKRCDI